METLQQDLIGPRQQLADRHVPCWQTQGLARYLMLTELPLDPPLQQPVAWMLRVFRPQAFHQRQGLLGLAGRQQHLGPSVHEFGSGRFRFQGAQRVPFDSTVRELGLAQREIAWAPLSESSRSDSRLTATRNGAGRLLVETKSNAPGMSTRKSIVAAWWFTAVGRANRLIANSL